MTLGTKKSLPGKHKIIHDKYTEDPKRPLMILERAHELGIISDELIIAPLLLRVTQLDNKNEHNQVSIE